MPERDQAGKAALRRRDGVERVLARGAGIGADDVVGVRRVDVRADRGRGVVVLGLRQQQRRAALDVAQVDVVAQRRADDRARPR
jgi:hypothetical protein